MAVKILTVICWVI